MQDINFDPLAERFEQKIYGGLKGRIRLAVLERDLRDGLPWLWRGGECSVLDAGGGLGVFARQFALSGHQVALCDISAKMLARARLQAGELVDHIQWYHESIQQHAVLGLRYDVVVCHAVLEWTADPDSVLAALQSLLNPGGYLSLMFYNQAGLIYRNLVRGNLNAVAAIVAGQQQRQGDTLTPLQPLQIGRIHAWLAAAKFNVLAESGIRVFYDYMLPAAGQRLPPENIVEAELNYSRDPAFMRLGRYYHILAQQRG